MLSGSGHIAGVVNPPDKVKYQYWTGGKPRQDARAVDGSGQGASRLVVAALGRVAGRASGEWTVPREPGENLGVIEDAPGSYVKAKS